MFEQSLLTGAVSTRRAWTVPLGFAGQIAVVAGLALIPTVFFEGLPQARLMPPQLTVPRPYRAMVQQHNVAQVVGVKYARADHEFTAPSFTPRGVRLPKEQPTEAADATPPCTGVCVQDSVGPSTFGPAVRVLLPDAAIDVKPPVQHLNPRPTPTPIRVTRGVQEAKLIHRVVPVYPALAIKLRVEGVVHLAAAIGADGRIEQLQLLSGHPLLAPAALEAVRQWVYRPTMLSGAPVEVLTDITVTFTLSR